MSSVATVFQFEGFRLDVRQRLLWRGDVALSLPVKALEVLGVLVAAAGAVCTRDALLTQVWRDAEVEDSSLTQAILVLRRALRDPAENPRLIETVARRGYRFAAAVECLAEPAATAPPPLPDGGIAVLPLADLSGNQDAAYLGIGLADALIARLTTFPDLRVRPGNLAQHLAERMDPLAVGQALKVDRVLCGSLRTIGDRLTVNAQLLDVHRGAVLWAERCGESLGDVFEVEERLADRLLQTLAPQLQTRWKADLSGTRDPEAYRLFLQGSHAAKLLRRARFAEAGTAFAAALARDPDFARAWLGWALAHLNAVDLWLPPAVAMPEARRCAQRALALDPTLAAAHAVLAGVHFWFERDRAASDAAIGLALAADPGGAGTLRLAAGLCAQSGRQTEALELLERAAACDPLDLELHQVAAAVHYFGRRYALAIDAARRLQQFDPQSWIAQLMLGRCLEAEGQPGAAISHYQAARRRAPEVAEICGDLGRALGLSGAPEAARALLAELPGSGLLVPAWVEAQILLGLGATAECLSALERTLDERSWFCSWLICAPMLDPLRDEPRFQALHCRALSDPDQAPATQSPPGQP